MGKRLVAVFLMGLVTLGVGQVALAYGPGGAGGPGGMVSWWAKDELQLTSEQQKQLTELKIRHLEETNDLRLAQETLGLELRNLWSEEPLDKEAIAAKEEELTKARIQLVEVRRELQKEAEGIFTAEQLEKLNTNSESWGPMHRRGGRGVFGGHGRGMSRGQRGSMGRGR